MSERKCLRCGAPYEEGATICFTCGASIGELETPTQPVRISKKAIVEAAEQEVLANDGAAEPEALANAEASAVAVAAAELVAPKRVMVGSSLRAPTLPQKPTRKPLRVNWPIAIVVAVVVVALAVGGGIVLRAALAGPTVAATVAYHDPQGRFALTVPALWTATSQSDGALLTDSSGANSAAISVAYAQTGQTATNVADTLAKAQKLQAAQPAQFAGDTWQQRSGQVIGQDGATREIVVLVDIHNGELYTIQLSSPASSFSSINNQVYQPLLASFTFG